MKVFVSVFLVILSRPLLAFCHARHSQRTNFPLCNNILNLEPSEAASSDRKMKQKMKRLSTFIFHRTSHPWSQHKALVWLVFVHARNHILFIWFMCYVVICLLLCLRNRFLSINFINLPKPDKSCWTNICKFLSNLVAQISLWQNIIEFPKRQIAQNLLVLHFIVQLPHKVHMEKIIYMCTWCIICVFVKNGPNGYKDQRTH